jgi:urease accessory protein
MSHTELEVGPAAGRPRVTVRTDGPRGRGHLGIRVLDVGRDRVRVALVAEGALLVAGDDVSVGVRVGPGVRLEVVEPAGTVAFEMRGGSARWAAAIEVADGGELVWRAEPFVVAAGAVVHRDVRVALAGSGTALLREVLVLGRVRESGGVLSQRLRALGPAGPLLAEDLQLDGVDPGVGVLGSHRVVDSVSLLGRRATGTATPTGAHRLELEGTGTVLRHCGDQTHTSPLDDTWLALAAARRPEPAPV